MRQLTKFQRMRRVMIMMTTTGYLSMNINLVDGSGSVELSQNHSRRLWEYKQWEEIKDMLLRCCYKRGAFMPNEIVCCKCMRFEITRSLDCGHKMYYCANCALNSHDTNHHFHALKRFEVRIKLTLYLANMCSLFIIYEGSIWISTHPHL